MAQKLNKKQKWFNLLEDWFNINIVRSLSGTIYGILFFLVFVLAFNFLEIFRDLHIETQFLYFFLVIDCFMITFSIYFADINFSKSEGIFWVSTVLFLGGFVLTIIKEDIMSKLFFLAAGKALIWAILFSCIYKWFARRWLIKKWNVQYESNS